MLIKLCTDKSVTDAASAVQLDVTAYDFGVKQVHNLQKTMQKKGVDFRHECLIFEVCQPQQAKRVLEANLGVCTTLPCRISINEGGSKTTFATLKPTSLLAMFDSPKLKDFAQKVEETLVQIMKDVAH